MHFQSLSIYSNTINNFSTVLHMYRMRETWGVTHIADPPDFTRPCDRRKVGTHQNM